MEQKAYKDFILYMLSILKEDSVKLQGEKINITGDEVEASYLKGQLYAYFHFFNLFKSQCEAFNISEKDLEIETINQYDLLVK